MTSEIELRVNYHPSGNYTLMEKPKGYSTYKDAQGALFANNDATKFYKALAARLAKYSAEGISVVSYIDGGP